MSKVVRFEMETERLTKVLFNPSPFMGDFGKGDYGVSFVKSKTSAKKDVYNAIDITNKKTGEVHGFTDYQLGHIKVRITKSKNGSVLTNVDKAKKVYFASEFTVYEAIDPAVKEYPLSYYKNYLDFVDARNEAINDEKKGEASRLLAEIKKDGVLTEHEDKYFRDLVVNAFFVN